jgi:CBS domain containing-hemolysin-like protein
MIELLFLIAAIVGFVKKEFRISRHRTLRGRPVIMLSSYYLGTVAVNVAVSFAGANALITQEFSFWLSTILFGAAFAVTLGVIIWSVRTLPKDTPATSEQEPPEGEQPAPEVK